MLRQGNSRVKCAWAGAGCLTERIPLPPDGFSPGRLPCASPATSPNATAFEVTSKRRKSYPSETRVKRGVRVVHGEVELVEKLGRNDLCPCGSGRLFQAVLPEQRPL